MSETRIERERIKEEKNKYKGMMGGTHVLVCGNGVLKVEVGIRRVGIGKSVGVSNSLWRGIFLSTQIESRIESQIREAIGVALTISTSCGDLCYADLHM